VKLSVLMAVRNGDPYVREAIESVLAQSFTDFEFLIVDDASTDDTPGILSAYRNQDSRIRVLRNERQLGPYPSANRALLHARGNVVARHDADDISPPRRFAIQLKALDSDQDTSLVSGAVEFFGGDGDVNHISRPPSWQPRLEWELLFRNAVAAGAHVMFPRIFRGAQVLFPAKHFYAEDYGLWCRLSRIGRVECPAQVVYRYRQHAQSITVRNKAEQVDCLSRMRHEHQAHYLRSEVSRETVTDVSRFWNEEGGCPFAGRAPMIYSILVELRANFLAYVEERHGPAAKAALEDEIEQTLDDRLGYWFYRSLKSLDGKASGDWLQIARARQKVASVSGKVFGHAADGLIRKLS
jgi:glycosyltransferase involved in cell wall biosynthesis